MAQRKELLVCNTRYRKREEHLITFSSGGRSRQLDYTLIKQSKVKNLKDCKVIPGSVVLNMWKSKEHKLKVRKVGRFKIWKLQMGEIKSKFRDVVKMANVKRSKEGEVEEIWQELKETLRKASDEVLGRTNPGRKEQRESWWWNEDVRQVLKQKKLAFKKWQKSKLEGDKDEYKLKRREAKMIVAIARKQSTEELYDELETKEGKKRIYRIAKARQREREETGNIDIIKDKEGKMLFDEDKISLRWAEYFEELLNVENKREELTEMYKVEGPEKGIEVKEVREAMSGMKSNKAPGVSEVSIDMLRAGGEECLIWMSDLLKAAWVKEKIPEDWRKSLIVPIFKKKGDILECGNYRGIKLLEHELKILERILDKRIRKAVKIDPKQFGFMPGNSTVDVIFIVRQLVEKRIEGNLAVFCGFVDLEKAYDRVPREVLYWCLRRKGVSEKLVRMVTETYQDCKTAVRTIEGLSREFEIGVGYIKDQH